MPVRARRLHWTWFRPIMTPPRPTVVLRNNSLQPQSTATLVATLLDENNKVLEIKTPLFPGR